MRRRVKFSTVCQAIIAAVFLSKVAVAEEPSSTTQGLPLFRTVENTERPDIPRNLPVRLVADADFAPFSFVSRTGAPAGLAVELAIAACERAELDCTVEARPFDDLLPALLRGEADAAVTGPRLDSGTLTAALATRPYFRGLGRFAVTGTSTLREATPVALGAARIGVVSNSLHARWLESYYPAATIAPFDNLAAVGGALKTGEVDVIFGDNLQVIYWVSGEAAAGCCRLLGAAFSDLDFFSRDLAFLVRRDRPDIRQALDYGLDQAQSSGATARILQTYVPLPLW